MDVRLSTEQQALRDSVAHVVDRLGPQTVGQLDDVERTEKLDAAVAASGWHELRTPEGGDAPLASGVEAALVAEELGRGLADVAYLGPTLAAELRRLSGAPLAADAETVVFAPGLASAARVADGALPAGAVAVDARGAASALALQPGIGGYALVEIDLHGAEERVDRTRALAAIDAGAPPRAVEGARPLTDDDLARWAALGLALTSADLVGVIRGAVELSRDYAVARHQYGAPIGSFQAIQHLLADAFVAMEGARSATLYAAWVVDALPAGDALAAGALAKAYCARAAREVCETAIQVHGGIGNTWECLAHIFLRRALLSSDVLGGVGPSLARVLAHHGIGDTNGLR